MKSSQYHLNHVVLADDDEDHALLFHFVLKQTDPSKILTIVKNGEELMHYLDSNIPDLLFLDLDMPVKHGFQCLKEIRNNPQMEKLPIVVYSSSTLMIDIKRSYLHKADLYMVKPFQNTSKTHLRQYST